MPRALSREKIPLKVCRQQLPSLKVLCGRDIALVSDEFAFCFDEKQQQQANNVDLSKAAVTTKQKARTARSTLCMK
jgi:hypothetical protein